MRSSIKLFWMCLILGSFNLVAQTADVTKACAPISINFEPPLGFTTWYWDFKDGVASVKEKPSHIFSSPGIYNVEFKEKIDGAVIGSIMIQIIKKPVLNINSKPVVGCVPLDVTFEDKSVYLSEPKILSKSWVFGDGGYGLGGLIIHNYNFANNFDVSFEIKTDLLGCDVSTIFPKVVLVNPLPKVYFTTIPEPPASCSIPFDVEFNDATTGTKPFQYQWSFGNGNISINGKPNNQNYNTLGTFPVKLMITDANGCKSDTTRDVKTGTLIVKVNFPDTICTNSDITFENKSSAGYHSWVFGPDASMPTADFRSPTISFKKAGWKNIKYSLKTGDNKCKVDTTFHIYVIDRASALVAEYDTNDCSLPIEISFKFKAKAGDLSWKFGNGIDSIKFGNGKTKNVSFTYPNDKDNYSIIGDRRLFVYFKSDSLYGCPIDTTLSIPIKILTAVFNIDTIEGCAPLKVTFKDLSFSKQAIIKWKWDFGDGTQLVSTDSISPMHIYEYCGIYYPKLIVQNSAGCIDTSNAIKIKICGVCDTINGGGSGGGENPTSEDIGIVGADGGTIVACHGNTYAFSIKNNRPLFWTQTRIESDNFRLHHCPQDTIVTWTFNHEPGYHDLILTAISINGDIVKKVYKNAILAKGAWAQGAFMFKGCAEPYSFMFSDSSQNATSIKWIFPDESTSNSKNVVKEFPTKGTFKVLLVAYNDIDGCPPDTTSFNISTNKFQPKILLPKDSFCAGIIPLSVNADYFTSCNDGITWSFTDTIYPVTTGDNNSFTKITKPGKYIAHVKGFDENGCIYETSSDFWVHDIFPKFETLPSQICLPYHLYLKDISTTETSPLVEYNWYINDSIYSTKKDDVILIDSSFFSKKDTLHLWLAVKSNLGCSKSTDTISITLYKPNSSIILSDTILCANEVFQADATDYNEQGSSLDYKWDFGDGKTANTKNPYHSYTKEGFYQLKMIFTEKSSSCTDTLYKKITVLPAPNANFTTDVDTIPVLCYPKNIYFTSVFATDSLKYFWNFGNGQTSNFKDVASFYTKGNYTATLIIENSQGCRDTSSRSFVLVGPEGDFTLDKSPLCIKDNLTVTLKDTTEVGSWTWDFGDGVTKVGGNPVQHYYDFTSLGDSTIIKLVLNDVTNACKVIIEKLIPVTNVKADFQLQFGDTIICKNSINKIKNLSPPNLNYKWTFSNGMTSTEYEPSFQAPDSGIIYIQLIVSDPIAACTDSITKAFKVQNFILPVLDDVIVCQGDSIVIGLKNDISGASFAWMPATGLQNPLGFQTLAYPSITTAYTLNGMLSNGCSSTTSITVHVIPKYTGMLSFEKSVAKGTPVTLTIGTLGVGYKYTWQPNALLSCSNCNEPIYIADTSSTFTLTLQDSALCGIYLITFQVNVLPDKIEIPNVFTPNGDGKNDVFQVVVPGGNIKDIGILKFEIYDRWGQKIFANGNTEKGWDGTHKGIPCPSDIYVYVIEVGFFNGDIKKYRGDISLVR